MEPSFPEKPRIGCGGGDDDDNDNDNDQQVTASASAAATATTSTTSHLVGLFAPPPPQPAMPGYGMGDRETTERISNETSALLPAPPLASSSSALLRLHGDVSSSSTTPTPTTAETPIPLHKGLLHDGNRYDSAYDDNRTSVQSAGGDGLDAFADLKDFRRRQERVQLISDQTMHDQNGDNRDASSSSSSFCCGGTRPTWRRRMMRQLTQNPTVQAIVEPTTIAGAFMFLLYHGMYEYLSGLCWIKTSRDTLCFGRRPSHRYFHGSIHFAACCFATTRVVHYAPHVQHNII